MKIQDLGEATFNTSVELVQHIVDNYNRAGHKNWKVEPVTVEGRPAKYAKPKDCFGNAFRYISRENLDATYVLGFVVVGNVPLEHAWVNDNGRYIDPTLKSGEYIKVVELPAKEVMRFAFKKQYAPTLFDALKM